MVVVITGNLGIGKTTVCEKLLAYANKQGLSCGGVLTYKTKNDNRVVLDIQNGDKFIFARKNCINEGLYTPRYIFDPGGIDFGIRAIENGASADILFIDELGPIELMGQGFAPALETVRTEAKKCVLVIRKGLITAFASWIGPDPLVFETTCQNRNVLPLEIARSCLAEYVCLDNQLRSLDSNTG
jgi:nucleoside-triphosphatase